MRRQLAVLALCGLLVFAGCAEVEIDLGGSGVPSAEEPTTPEAAPPASGTFEAHFLNVGQADATLLRTGNETMLIDSGDWRDDGETVIDHLESRGVDRIDHLVSTHGHADHVGGHAAIIDHYETEKEGVGAIYDSGVPHTSGTYENYLDAVDSHDVDLFEVAEGDEIPFDGVRATVVNPAGTGGDDIDNDAVAVHLQFGSTAYLFTGDIERAGEERMVEAHGGALEADVYQVGHHGSDTSSGPAFLDAVDPDLAVISSAYDSEYGHPHDEPLERFAERDVAVTWTATHGTTVVESDGENLSVRAQHDATTDPLAVRDADRATADPGDPSRERVTVGSPPARIVPVGPARLTVAGGEP